MTDKLELTITDTDGDKVEFLKSAISGRGYVSVNGSMQVRLSDEHQARIADFFAEEAPVQEELGPFYLLRQRKDNPLKIKVMYAGTASARLFTTRAKADEAHKRMTDQHGSKFTFTVVKEVK